MVYFTGIDLHKAFILLTTVDPEGKVVKRRRLSNKEAAAIAEYFTTLDGEHKAVVESGVGWYWLRDLLESISVDLIMAHPIAVKAIVYAKVKTDAVDSLTLANLLRGGFIPESYMIRPEWRALRDLIRRRHRLVNQRTRSINACQGVLQAVNCTVEELEPLDRLNYESLQSIIGALRCQIEGIESAVAEALSAVPEYLLLLTIPGIGPVHAAEILLEIDTIERFTTERRFFSYVRVVPGANNSGKRTASKRSKAGNRHLRRALGDAAVHAVSQHSQFQEHFKRLERKHPEAVAWTLVTKEIARGVFHVLRRREPYKGLKGVEMTQRKASERVVLRRLSELPANTDAPPSAGKPSAPAGTARSAQPAGTRAAGRTPSICGKPLARPSSGPRRFTTVDGSEVPPRQRGSRCNEPAGGSPTTRNRRRA